MSTERVALDRSQEWSLVLLRTLVGWHFLYEGFVKLWLPAWSREGAPLRAWSSAGYLRSSSGPFAPFFRGLADSSALPLMDSVIALALVLVGLSLLLGLFARAGALGALLLLGLFYLAQIPTAGVQQPGAEGAYLLVNKTLVEAAAVLVLFVFRTERIAGLDLLRSRAPRHEPSPAPVERTA
ncbi:MAG TPA: DoxX subfamily [Vicinamibacteria bacterium]